MIEIIKVQVVVEISYLLWSYLYTIINIILNSIIFLTFILIYIYSQSGTSINLYNQVIKLFIYR
jgi:hypothetical protein